MIATATLGPAVVPGQTHATQLARHGGGGNGLTTNVQDSRLWNTTVVEVLRQALWRQMGAFLRSHLDVGASDVLTKPKAPPCQPINRPAIVTLEKMS